MVQADVQGDLDRIRELLGKIVQELHSSEDLETGENALDQVATIVNMPWTSWVPDVAQPYFCREVDDFARRRGWPEELLNLWWARHINLKMPFYIRCRFEHLPFVTELNRSSRRRLSPEHLRVNELIGLMDVTTMLTVPLHLPKGQIGMVTWAGSRALPELDALLGAVAGDLLGIGHHFMRIANLRLAAHVEERWRLTPREWDCLRMLAQGYREAEIGTLAGIAKSTVRFHLDNVVEKFGVRNRTQAVALAAQLGMLGPIGT